MGTKAASNAWRCVSLIGVVLVQIPLLAAAVDVNVGTSGEYTFSGQEGLSVKVAFTCPDGKTFMQIGNELRMPKPWIVRYTLSCVLPPHWSVESYNSGGYGTWDTGTTQNTSLSVTVDPTKPLNNGHTPDFEHAYVTFKHEEPGWTPYYANVSVPVYTSGVRYQTSITAPGSPENFQGFGVQVIPDGADAFNAKLQVHAVQASPRGPDDMDPAVGAQVTAVLTDDGNNLLPWKSSTAIADSNGIATVLFGSGAGPGLEAEGAMPGSALYLKVVPKWRETNGACDGYIPKTYVLPKFAGLAGHLDVQVVDVDGHGLPAEVLAWGGPFPTSLPSIVLPYSQTRVGGITGVSGAIRLDVNPRGLTEGLVDKAYTAKIAPRVNMELIYTQLIDFPADLVVDVPHFISPRFTLHPNAYSYAPAHPGDDFPVCTGGRIELLDDASGGVLQEQSVRISLSQPDETKLVERHDRAFLPVKVTREEKVRRTRIVFDDVDGGSKDGKLAASEELKYLIQATREKRKPGFYTVDFVVCAVGKWSSKAARPSISADLQVQMDYFQDMFPVSVMFGSGGVLTPSFWFWQNGPAAITSLMRQLQERQRATGVDRVIGLVPPHWADDILPESLYGTTTPGLQIKGINGAVMIDLSQVSEAIGAAATLHEFLHTQGFLDILAGNYLGIPDQLPPSANGYCARRDREFLNLTGHVTNTARVMYGFCTDANWLNNDEYYNLMDLLYKPSSESYQSAKSTAVPKTAFGPRMRMHGYFNLNGGQAVLDPVFSDVGEAYNPYSSTAPSTNMFYLEMLGAGQESLGIYYIPAVPPVIHCTPGPGMTTPIPDISLESRYSALFDFSVPAETRLAAVRMGQFVPGAPPTVWQTVNVSANAPTLQWVGAPTGTLSQATDIEWTATDPDSPNAALAHEFYVSSNGGVTWQQADNSVPSRQAGDQKVYFYTFNPADWPSSGQYRFKVLASDGLRTSELASSANATVSGYDPNPKAGLLIDKWEASRPETGFFTVLVPLRNGGRGLLEVSPDPASLPSWLSRPDTEPTKVPALSDGLLILNGKQDAAGTFEATVMLNTNDPASPTLTLPVKLVQGEAALAPRIARIDLDPDCGMDRPWLPGEKARFTLWDNDCRTVMETSVTVSPSGSAKTALVTGLPMVAGPRAGEYQVEWTIPADAPDGQYTLEFTLRDPVAGKDAKDGTRTLTIQRPTSPEGEGENEGDGYVMVPNVAGQTQAAASATLAGEHLVVGTITEQCSDTVAAGRVISQNPVEMQSLPEGGAVALTLSKGPFQVAVPNLWGMSQAEAANALSGAHLVAGAVSGQCSDTVDEGKVIGQDPAQGALIPNGAAVALVLANGLCRTIVPNFVGMSQEAATNALSGVTTLVLGDVWRMCSDSVTQGTVISQMPFPGTSVQNGYGISLTVSTGPCNAKVPGLLGLTQAEAAVALSDAHLVLGTVTQHCSGEVPAGRIYFQSPAEQTDASNGSVVLVTISTGPCGTEGEITEGEVTEGEVAEGEVAEGEVIPPATIEEAAQELTSAFATADADHSGGLSQAEANGTLAGLTAAQFAQLDTNGDGQITLHELNQTVNPGGCACGKSGLAVKGFKNRLADLFLMGIALGSLLVIRGRKP